jgi:uncharacterized protein YhhL (DUF1145 family)
MQLALKLGVIATWLVAAIGFLLPSETTFGLVGRTLFWLLTIVHAVECVVFYGTLRRTGRPLALELLQTLVFGVVHYAEARALADARAGGGPAGSA